MNFTHPNAFKPFYRKSVVFRTRTDDGIVERAGTAVVLPLASPENRTAGLAAGTGEWVVVIVEKATDWVVDTPPKPSDTVDTVEYGEMNVQRVQKRAEGGFTLECLSRQTRVMR